MIIEQITRTTIKADEGKLLVRKSDGWVAGEQVSLGYNYYEAGVALSNPRLEQLDDYEEIDKPEDYEVKPIINHVQRLKRTTELIAKNIKEMNELSLSAVDALEVKDWYPKWGVDEGFCEGDTVTKNTKFQHEGKLYACLQDHVILAHYEPSINTASLYVEVTEDYTDAGEEMGTVENPIPYEGNMVLENGKYYSQDGVVYLCNRDSGNPAYHALKDLVGLYVEVV
ncbi:MAG: hypothetical protein J6V52_02380 [Bacteroidaceae bacterium]|nr:hypothetical protein [Bacteroidaceae bacterium]